MKNIIYRIHYDNNDIYQTLTYIINDWEYA